MICAYCGKEDCDHLAATQRHLDSLLRRAQEFQESLKTPVEQ